MFHTPFSFYFFIFYSPLKYIWLSSTWAWIERVHLYANLKKYLNFAICIQESTDVKDWLYALIYAILCRGHKLQKILVSMMGSWEDQLGQEPIPHRYWGTIKWEGQKLYTDFWLCKNGQHWPELFNIQLYNYGKIRKKSSINQYVRVWPFTLTCSFSFTYNCFFKSRRLS